MVRGWDRTFGRDGPAPAAAGFSLLELIVVLALAGIFLSLVLPSFSGTLESARLRSGAAEVRATLSRARTLAAFGGRERGVSFDLDRRAYGIPGEEERLLPDGIRIAEAVVGMKRSEEGSVRVRFYPDGSAEEAEFVVVSGGGGRLRVTVDPLTGIVEAGT